MEEKTGKPKHDWYQYRLQHNFKRMYFNVSLFFIFIFFNCQPGMASEIVFGDPLFQVNEDLDLTLFDSELLNNGEVLTNGLNEPYDFFNDDLSSTNNLIRSSMHNQLLEAKIGTVVSTYLFSAIKEDFDEDDPLSGENSSFVSIRDVEGYTTVFIRGEQTKAFGEYFLGDLIPTVNENHMDIFQENLKVLGSTIDLSMEEVFWILDGAQISVYQFKKSEYPEIEKQEQDDFGFAVRLRKRVGDLGLFASFHQQNYHERDIYRLEDEGKGKKKLTTGSWGLNLHLSDTFSLLFGNRFSYNSSGLYLNEDDLTTTSLIRTSSDFEHKLLQEELTFLGNIRADKKHQFHFGLATKKNTKDRPQWWTEFSHTIFGLKKGFEWKSDRFSIRFRVKLKKEINFNVKMRIFF